MSIVLKCSTLITEKKGKKINPTSVLRLSAWRRNIFGESLLRVQIAGRIVFDTNEHSITHIARLVFAYADSNSDLSRRLPNELSEVTCRTVAGRVEAESKHFIGDFRLLLTSFVAKKSVSSREQLQKGTRKYQL